MTAGKTYIPTSWELGSWNNLRTHEGLDKGSLKVASWTQPSLGSTDSRFYIALRDPDLWAHRDLDSSLRSVKLFLKSFSSLPQPSSVVLRGVIAGGNTDVSFWRGYQRIPRDLDWTDPFKSESAVAYELQQKYQPPVTYGSYVVEGQARFTQASVSLDSSVSTGGDGVPFSDGYKYDLTSMVEEMLQAPERAAIADSSPFGYAPDESKYWFLFTAQASEMVEYPHGYLLAKENFYLNPEFEIVSPRNFSLGDYGLKSLELKSECHPSHPDKGIGGPDEVGGESAWYSAPVWEKVDLDGDEAIPGVSGGSYIKEVTDVSDFIAKDGESDSTSRHNVWQGQIARTFNYSDGSGSGTFDYLDKASSSFVDGVPRIGRNQYHYPTFFTDLQSPLGFAGKELTVSFWAKHDVESGQSVGSFPYQEITKGKTYPVFGSRRADPSKPIYDDDPNSYDGFAYGFEVRIGMSAFGGRPIIEVRWQDRFHWAGFGKYRGGRSNQLGTLGTAHNYWRCEGSSAGFDPTGDGYNHYLLTLGYSGEGSERGTADFWKCWVNGTRAGQESTDFREVRTEGLETNTYYRQPQVLTYSRSRHDESFTDQDAEDSNFHKAETWNVGHVNYYEPETESFSGLLDDVRLFDYQISSERQIEELASGRLANTRILSIPAGDAESKSEASIVDVVMRNLMMREGGSESSSEAKELSLSISNFADANSVDVVAECQPVNMKVPATSDSAESSSEYSAFGLSYSALADAKSIEASAQASVPKVDISGAASPDVVESRSQASPVSLGVDRTLNGIGGESCWISPSRDNDNEDTSETENFVPLKENIQVQSGQWRDDSVDGGDHSFEIGKAADQTQGRVQLPGGIF